MGGGGSGKTLNYEDVFQQSSPMNFTVYCGGISDSDENTIRAAFFALRPHHGNPVLPGQRLRIRSVSRRCKSCKKSGNISLESLYRYDNKESACSAIVAVNCTEIGGQPVKCSWGKENPSMAGGGLTGGMNPGGEFMRHDMGPPHPHYDQQQQQMYYQPQQYYYDSQQYHMMQPQYYGGYGGHPGGGRNNY